MNAAALPAHILSELTWHQQVTTERLSTGSSSLDNVIEGCPRGRITEITGPVSSGRTTLLYSILGEASRLGEFCAVVDTSNAFDPVSAAAAGVHLNKLVWIRCSGNASDAIKAADLLLHSGGFGVIALDLCDVPPRVMNRIPISWWYRFRRAIENTPAVFVVLDNEPVAKSCASLLLEMKREQAMFRGTTPFEYLDKAQFQAVPKKPLLHPAPRFEAYALR